MLHIGVTRVFNISNRSLFQIVVPRHQYQMEPKALAQQRTTPMYTTAVILDIVILVLLTTSTASRTERGLPRRIHALSKVCNMYAIFTCDITVKEQYV